MPEETPNPKELFRDFVQLGAVVADIEHTIQVLSEVFGIGPWRITDWPPEDRTDLGRRYYDQPGEFTARMAFAELGPIELELIQPVNGASIWADFLAERGGGLHHIRFNVPEMEPVVEYLAGHDIAVAQTAAGIRPGTRWANFGTEHLIGFVIEVMRPVPGTSGRTPALVDGKVVG